MSVIYDYLRAALVIVAFIAGKQNKKSAWSFDLLLTAWFGMGCYLFPQIVVEKIFGTTFNAALNLGVQNVGASFLSVAAFNYMCLKSRDETVIGSIALSKAMGFLPLLVSTLYTFIKNEKSVTHSGFCLLLTIFSAVWLMNVIVLMETRPVIGRREHKGAVSIVFRVLFLVLLLQGLGSLALSSSIASFHNIKSTVPMTFLIQSVGAVLISKIFILWYAPCFIKREDRRNVFVSLLLFVVLFQLAILNYCYQKKEGAMATVQHMAPTLLMMALSSVGCYLLSREDPLYTNTHYTRSKSN